MCVVLIDLNAAGYPVPEQHFVVSKSIVSLSDAEQIVEFDLYRHASSYERANNEKRVRTHAELKSAVTKNPRFEPLIDGSVKSDKLNLDIHVTTPPELFYRT